MTQFTAEVKRQGISEAAPRRKSGCHASTNYKVWNVLVNGENFEYIQPNRKTAEDFAWFIENVFTAGDAQSQYDKWSYAREIARSRAAEQEAKIR
jgi:hypothetical protein